MKNNLILFVTLVFIVSCIIQFIILCVKDFHNKHGKLDMKCKKCGGSYEIINFYGKDTNYRRSYACKKCGIMVYRYSGLEKDETEIIADKMFKYMIKERNRKALKELRKKVKSNE